MYYFRLILIHVQKRQVEQSGQITLLFILYYLYVKMCLFSLRIGPKLILHVSIVSLRLPTRTSN